MQNERTDPNRRDVQWLGLTILVIAVAMAADDSGDSTGESGMHRLDESSTSFDLEDFRPFLERLACLTDDGLGEAKVDFLSGLAARLPHGGERTLRYEIGFEGERVPLHLALFKDELEGVSVHFLTTARLALAIDSEMERFFAERGQ